MKETIVVSFSGGETSAFMAGHINLLWRDEYDVVNIFANTGEENEETLIFADKCNKYFGLNLVWVEAVTNPIKGKGVRHKVVSFEVASRNGEPFEAMVSKHGIPNRNFPHCSRELKQRVIKSYIRSIGLNNYKIAIGIRGDEIDRVSDNYKKENLIYPLLKMKFNVDKPFINRYWRDQPFRLELKAYEGNCKACWKKSLRKLLTIAKETPEAYDVFERLEKTYESFTPEGRTNAAPPYRFFRGNRTVAEIMELSKTNFSPAKDEAQIFRSQEQLSLIEELDKSDGCTESCEVF